MSTATVPMLFSADETTDVGSDTATPVSDDYAAEGQRVHGRRCAGSSSTRRGREDVDHLDHAEERFRIAMARQ